MKDVDSCDKPRGGANTRRSVDFRIGKPSRDNLLTHTEFIGMALPTGRTETSKYPEEQKSNQRFP